MLVDENKDNNKDVRVDLFISCYLICVQLKNTHGGRHDTHRRRGGSREQGQNASTGHDEVIHHLGDEVYAVVDKHNVLAAVHKVQNGLCGVTEKKTKGRYNVFYDV